jgi:hypothetical protein
LRTIVASGEADLNGPMVVGPGRDTDAMMLLESLYPRSGGGSYCVRSRFWTLSRVRCLPVPQKRAVSGSGRPSRPVVGERSPWPSTSASTLGWFYTTFPPGLSPMTGHCGRGFPPDSSGASSMISMRGCLRLVTADGARHGDGAHHRLLDLGDGACRCCPAVARLAADRSDSRLLAVLGGRRGRQHLPLRVRRRRPGHAWRPRGGTGLSGPPATDAPRYPDPPCPVAAVD